MSSYFKVVGNSCSAPTQLEGKTKCHISKISHDGVEDLLHRMSTQCENVKEIDRQQSTSFGGQVRFSLRNGTLPLLVSDGLMWNNTVEWLLWCIRGSTNAKTLRDKNIPACVGSSWRDDGRIAQEEVADLGPVYGFQWRHFGAEYTSMHSDYKGQGIDQLLDVVNKVRNVPNDRRIIISSWNPRDLARMTIAPCQALVQFYVANGELSCQLYQVSVDLVQDLAFIIATYALLTHLIAHVCGKKTGDFVLALGEMHVNKNCLDEIATLFNGERKPFPNLVITKKVEKIEDFDKSDLELQDIQPEDATIDSNVELSTVTESNMKENTDPLRDSSDEPVIKRRKDEGRHDEYQYLDAIRLIIEHGVLKQDRTKVGTYSIFGKQMRFSLRGGTFPLLTTKKVFWRGIAEELFWFIRGCTNAKELQDINVRIWDGNSSRQYLDSIGLSHRDEGDLGPVYGFQWRHFGAEYQDMHSDYSGQGIDQLADVIDRIRNDPTSRIVMCAWNPKDLALMALPPCHALVQFYVNDGELSCQLYQRSADMGLGVPFNIASYSLLTHMIAHVCGLQPGDFVHTLGDAHVYTNHVEPLREQLTREPKPFPKLIIKQKVEHIEDFKFSDFELVGYESHPRIQMDMAV